PIITKPGIQTPEGLSAVQQNEWLIDLFIYRTPATTITERHFRSLADLWKNGGDMTKESAEKRVNLDYNFKRQPSAITTVESRGTVHIAFTTKAWRNAEQFLQARADWRQFARGTQRCLKTEDDLAAFNQY